MHHWNAHPVWKYWWHSFVHMFHATWLSLRNFVTTSVVSCLNLQERWCHVIVMMQWAGQFTATLQEENPRYSPVSSSMAPAGKMDHRNRWFYVIFLAIKTSIEFGDFPTSHVWGYHEGIWGFLKLGHPRNDPKMKGSPMLRHRRGWEVPVESAAGHHSAVAFKLYIYIY